MSIHNYKQGNNKAWADIIATSIAPSINIIEDVEITNPQNGDLLVYDNTTQKWDNQPGGGGGEINTASNVGGANGVFKQKAGADLEFKSLAAGTNITITNNPDTLLIEASSTPADIETGIYNPLLNPIINISSVLVAEAWYTRIENNVTVSINGTLETNSIGGSSFQFSLPIPPDNIFNTSGPCIGNMWIGGENNQIIVQPSQTGNKNVQITFNSSTIRIREYGMVITYKKNN